MSIPNNVKSFIETLENYSEYTPSVKTEQNGVSYLSNQFWTSGQRKGHSLHEVSYRACFKPELPRFFIERLTTPGQCILDPFSGRGTTAIEASLLGRKAIANDINPVSKMLVLPRTNTPSMAEIQLRLSQMPRGLISDAPDDLLTFYHPQTLADLYAVKEWFRNRLQTGLDAVDQWIRMVLLNRLTGHSKGFLSVYTLPPNQAVSLKSQAAINLKRQQIPAYRDYAPIVLKKSMSLLSDGGLTTIEPVTLYTGLAEAIPIPDNSVHLVVTSPPFLDVVDYAADNWLRCWFADIDPNAVPISLHSKSSDWRDMIHRTLRELCRVLVPGGVIAMEVGDVTSKKVSLERLVIEAAIGLPLERMDYVMINGGDFTKTANIWKVNNNSKGTNTNRIVLFYKQ